VKRVRDILFKEDSFVFSSRVSGILVHNGKVLVQCPPGTTEHAFIGGHVMVGETQAEALVREFMEEIHAPVTPVKLLAVGEVFIPWGKRPAHQIGLYYKVQLDDLAAIPLEGSFRGYDELGG
jgi:8-oxo-dGTP pyrophosphatase MutT (NUDIX family)